jgi:hypothetical protein
LQATVSIFSRFRGVSTAGFRSDPYKHRRNSHRESPESCGIRAASALQRPRFDDLSPEDRLLNKNCQLTSQRLGDIYVNVNVIWNDRPASIAACPDHTEDTGIAAKSGT